MKKIILFTTIVALAIAFTVWKEYPSQEEAQQDSSQSTVSSSSSQSTVSSTLEENNPHAQLSLIDPTQSQTTPEFAAQNAMNALFSFNPVEDKDPNDSSKRAAHFFTEPRRTILQDPEKAMGRPPRESPEWRGWKQSGDEVIAASSIVWGYEKNNAHHFLIDIQQIVLLNPTRKLDKYTYNLPLFSVSAKVVRCEDNNTLWCVEDYNIIHGYPAR